MPSGVNWGKEPGQLPSLSKTYYYFATDNREFAGQPGTSRVHLEATFDSVQIGQLKPLQPLFSAWDDPSYQLRAQTTAWARFGPNPIAGSLKAQTAAPTKAEYVVDSTLHCSTTWPEVGASYPFKSTAPQINYDMADEWCRRPNGDVELKITGTHDQFPAYEVIVNGTVVYKYYPSASGPGLFNLGVMWRDFRNRREITSLDVVA